MLSPFSLGRTLKLGLIALLAEMGSQFLLPPFGNHVPHSNFQNSGISGIAGGLTQQTAIVLAVIGVVFFLLGLTLLYFGSRMQFVLMDLVAYRTALVAPSWRKHGPRTWPWIGIKIASFLAVFAVVTAIVAWPVLHFIRSIPAGGSQPPNAAAIGNFLFLFAIILFVVLAFMLCIWALRDFVLPFVVFDGVSFRSAFSAAATLIGHEPGGVLLYFFMKFVLTLATAIAAELCILAAVLVGAIPLGLIGGAIWLLLHHAGLFGTTMIYVSFGLLTLIFFAFIVAVGVCVAGAVLLFYQAYTLYFLGGRIRTLGDLMEPPPPPIVQAAPFFDPA